MTAITACGLVTAAGQGVEALRLAQTEGRTCLQALDDELAAGLPVRFGGRVPNDALGSEALGDRVLRLAAPALEGVLADARLPEALCARAGLTVGTGLGSMERTERFLAGAHRGALLELHPHAITRALARGAGLGGPQATTTVTCASALYALELALGELEGGRAPAMVCGGLETLSRTILAGFCALDALSRSACPERPAANDGIVLGEGAAFVLLEPLDTARARGAAPLGVLRGRGLRTDGVHLTSPDPAGVGMQAAVEDALQEAGVAPGEVDRVTLTAPASPAYAELYRSALGRTLGAGWEERAISWEPAVGHALGASATLGLIEACLLLRGALGGGPARNVLSLTVGFGGLNGATLVGAP